MDEQEQYVRWWMGADERPRTGIVVGEDERGLLIVDGTDGTRYHLLRRLVTFIDENGKDLP